VGRLLLVKGLQIELNHIKTLKKWGITEVNVVDNDGGEELFDSGAHPETIEKNGSSLKSMGNVI